LRLFCDGLEVSNTGRMARWPLVRPGALMGARAGATFPADNPAEGMAPALAEGTGMFLRTILAVKAIALIMALLWGGPAWAQEIVIGHFGSMTGATATFGVSTDEGIRLAVDEINAAGGVLGQRIRLVTEDDQSRPEEAVTAVQKLINQDRVVALLGEVASSRSLAAAPVAQRARIPMLSPSSTNPKVTQVGDFIFRCCFIDPFQGAAIANFAMKHEGGPKATRLAILYDIKNDYSIGLREFFTKTVLANGGQIVADESYGEGDREFKAQLTKIKAANPQVIFVPGYYTEAALICRQARELGIAAVLMGGDGWDSDKLFEIGREAVNGYFFSNHYAPDEDRPEVQRFVQAYKQKYNGKVPDAMAILGYDAMKLLADAITRAGNTRGTAIRNALAATKDFPGASGRITMDAERNALKPIVIVRVDNGTFRFVASVQPDGK
jgi:branched-chain amino acid transport system substrate-binding protein